METAPRKLYYTRDMLFRAPRVSYDCAVVFVNGGVLAISYLVIPLLISNCIKLLPHKLFIAKSLYVSGIIGWSTRQKRTFRPETLV